MYRTTFYVKFVSILQTAVSLLWNLFLGLISENSAGKWEQNFFYHSIFWLSVKIWSPCIINVIKKAIAIFSFRGTHVTGHGNLIGNQYFIELIVFGITLLLPQLGCICLCHRLNGFCWALVLLGDILQWRIYFFHNGV